MPIMQMPGTVDADADIDIPFLNEIAPCRRQQHTVRLERMHDPDIRRPQALDHLERLAIKRDRRDQRFARMPDHVHGLIGPARGKQFLEQIAHSALRDHRPIIAARQVAVVAVDVAERRRLDNDDVDPRVSRHA